MFSPKHVLLARTKYLEWIKNQTLLFLQMVMIYKNGKSAYRYEELVNF